MPAGSVRDTIRSSREIERVFATGRRAATEHFVLLVAPTPLGAGARGRLAFVAGRKLGGAVTRNRAKRVLREAVRRAGGPWQGADVVVVARRSAATASAAELDAALALALARAGLKEAAA